MIANNLNDAAVKCSCETTTADTENKTPILPHSHSKHNHQISPDEWYASVTLEGPCITICNSRQSYKDLHDPSYKEGTLQAIDHPPQSGFTIS